MYEAVSGVLRDLLEVYSRERYPVRKAGVLVQMLEHAYYYVPGGGGNRGDSSLCLDPDWEKMVGEVEELTASTVSFSFVPSVAALYIFPERSTTVSLFLGIPTVTNIEQLFSLFL